MEEIKIYKKIDIVNPVMLAGWPGMGNVALGVVDYLRRKLKAVKFAEIEIDKNAMLDSVIVEDGLAKLPEPPRNTFYYSKNPDLIIFEGETQLAGQNGIGLLNKVLDLAFEYKVRRIYTGAAFPIPVSHKETPEVYSAVNNAALRNIIGLGVKPMESGHISGLNGLMLGFAQDRGIDAVCLLATMPQYAISLPNPKASGAIIQVLEKLLNFKADFREMDEYIKDMDEKMSVIEDNVKDVFIGDKGDRHAPQGRHGALPEKSVPAYIREKIENLFREAKLNRTKAMILKRELDRWDLYKAYEDRFLDLFKKGQ